MTMTTAETVCNCVVIVFCLLTRYNIICVFSWFYAPVSVGRALAIRDPQTLQACTYTPLPEVEIVPRKVGAGDAVEL